MEFKEVAANLGFDEDDFMELVELFVTTSLSDIDKIKKAVQNNNPADTASAFHSIKGAAGNLGFEDLFKLSRDMEMKAKKRRLENFDVLIADLENRVRALIK